MVLGQYRSVLIDTLWYWVNMERYWLIYDGTGSAEGVTGRYWVRRRQYWLIHERTGSVWGSTCWYLVALDQYKAVIVDP